MWPTLAETLRPHVAIYVRLALAAGFLTSVSDRLGLWGPSGTANVAWGTFQRFEAYTGQLNPWAPAPLIPPLAWFVTVAEIVSELRFSSDCGRGMWHWRAACSSACSGWV